MKLNRASTPANPESSAEVENEIRARAYQLYEQRGKQEGRDLDDWFQAESEMNQQIKEKNERHNPLKVAA